MELKQIDNITPHRPKSTTNDKKSFQKKALPEKNCNERSLIEKENLMNENSSTMMSKISQKPQEDLEVSFDFREEIEKRFKKSVVNKIYIFPRVDDEYSSEEETNSNASSNSLLKNVEIYDLKSQNYKEKTAVSKEKEQEQRNMSFQDFLTKIHQEKEKWNFGNINPSSIKKKMMSPDEETSKKPNKTLKNSESVSNNLSISPNNQKDIKVEDLKKLAYSFNNNKKKSQNERETQIKVIKGRKVIDLTSNNSHKLNDSSVSRKRENLTTNVFQAINSFHNRLFPKDKYNAFSIQLFIIFVIKSQERKFVSRVFTKEKLIE